MKRAMVLVQAARFCFHKINFPGESRQTWNRCYTNQPFTSNSIDKNSSSSNINAQRSATISSQLDETSNSMDNNDGLKPGKWIISRILSDLKKRNFVVPLPEEKLAVVLIPILEKLASNGLTVEFLTTECGQSDDFLQLLLGKNQEDLFDICEVLTNYGTLTYEEIFLMLKSIGFDISSSGGAKGVSGRLDVLLNISGVEYGRNLGELIRKCPPLIFAQEPEKITEIFNALRSFFNKKQLIKLIEYTPQILLMNFEELEPKYEYIFYQMGLEGEDLLGCRNWIEMSLEEIMLRHQCLGKSGRYHFPDPKAPQLRKENPDLHKILDSSDEHFSTKVAGISLEEWNVFKMIQRRADEEADKDEPFIKVKPSLRKKLERQRKAKVERPGEFVFEVDSKDQF